MHDQWPAAATLDADRLMALRTEALSRPGPNLEATGRPGSHATRRPGSGLDVRDVRPYQPGDELRHVDAMVTARAGRTHVRSYHDEQELVGLLVADFRHCMLWATRGRLRSVVAAEALASEGWRMLAAGARVGLLIWHDQGASYLAPRHHATAMARMAASLAASHREALEEARRRRRPDAPCPPLDQCLAQLVRLVPRRTRVVLASALDEPGAGFDAGLQALLGRARIELLLVRDALERRPPRARLRFFSAGGQVRWGRPGPADNGRLAALERLGARVRRIDCDAPDRDEHEH